MVEDLKAENRILHDRLTDKIVVTPTEKRRLSRHGSPLGAAVRDLITIVHPRTFLRWLDGDGEAGSDPRTGPSAHCRGRSSTGPATGDRDGLGGTPASSAS